MIAVLADTHMPRGPRRLPDRCTQLIAEAEAVIHAGDFTRRSVLDELEALCPRVYAVRGNAACPPCLDGRPQLRRAAAGFRPRLALAVRLPPPLRELERERAFAFEERLRPLA